jgi:DNA repair protein RecN (Recombination protein N)
LAQVQERRRLLADLRRKYGRDLAEVLAFAGEAETRLAELDAAEETAAVLAADRAVATDAVHDAETALRSIRLRAAPLLARAVEARLGSLAMPGARLEVHVAGTGAGDPVRFLLGANVGEPLQPLSKVASGGELARAMLALRLVASGGPPTMVFDEVDAGVGGEAALALGRALGEVATTRQVLVVTHLAQVAAFAGAQVAVHKTTTGGRTTTGATTLDDDGRRVELSRMLSGQPDSAAARATAEELLSLARSGGVSATDAPARGYRKEVHHGSARTADR